MKIHPQICFIAFSLCFSARTNEKNNTAIRKHAMPLFLTAFTDYTLRDFLSKCQPSTSVISPTRRNVSQKSFFFLILATIRKNIRKYRNRRFPVQQRNPTPSNIYYASSRIATLPTTATRKFFLSNIPAYLPCEVTNITVTFDLFVLTLLDRVYICRLYSRLKVSHKKL